MQQIVICLSGYSKRSDFCPLTSLQSSVLPIIRVKFGPRVLNYIFSSREEHTLTFIHINLFANNSEILFVSH